MRFEQGSCIACGQGTDTGLGVTGEAEWHVAFLVTLGIPEEQAGMTVLAWLPWPRVGRQEAVYRVCRACVERSPASFPAPVLDSAGAAFPNIVQP